MTDGGPQAVARARHQGSEPLTAELWLMGQAPRLCHISKVADNNLIFLSVTEGSESDRPEPMTDDPADLLIHGITEQGRLRIRARISNRTRERWILEPLEHSIAQLPLLKTTLLQGNGEAVASVRAPGLVNRSELLKQCQHAVTRYLTQHYASFYSSLDDAIVLAAATCAEDKNILLDAIRLIDQSHAQLEHNYISRVCWLIEAACKPDAEPVAARIEVETDLGRLCMRARRQNDEALDILAQRFSNIVHRLCDSTALPFGCSWLCQHFGDALAPLDLAPSAQRIVFRVFGETVLAGLGPLYAQLNTLLANHQVLPELDRDSEANSLEETTPTPTPAHKDHGFAPASHWENDANGADTRQLLLAASQLWSLASGNQDHSSTYAEACLGRAEIEALVAQRAPSAEPSSDLRRADGLDPEVRTIIEIVDQLLLNISARDHIPEEAAKLLRQLEPALLRVCISDAKFFSETSHAARQSLNLIARLCREAHFGNAAIRRQLQAICDRLCQQSSGNPAVFGAILSPLRELAERQKAACERNTARVVAMQEGQYKFQQAHTAVDEQLYQRYSGRPFPSQLTALLEHGWRKYMIHALLFEGSHSGAWEESLALLHGIYCGLVSEQQRGDLRYYPSLLPDDTVTALEQPLETLGIQSPQYHQLVVDLAELLQSAEPLPTIPLYPGRSEQSTDTELTAAADRWLSRCQVLQPGDWMGWLDNPEDEPIRLAWVSDDQRRFVFVNEQGHQLFDWPIHTVAENMKHGMQQVANPDAWPVVDDCLYQIAQQQHRQIVHAANVDSSCGALNLNGFEASLAEHAKLASYSDAEHALIGLELEPLQADGGKVDEHQHALQLQACVDTVTATCGDQAIIGRIDNYRFGVLLAYQDSTAATQLVDKLLAAMDGDSNVAGQGPGAYAGMVMVTGQSSSTVTLLQQLVGQLYQARLSENKRALSQDTASQQRDQQAMLEWITELGEILEQGRLRLRSQPILPMHDDGTMHHEILLGVADQEGNIALPGELISAAERYHRMDIIDRWVIQQTLRTLEQNPDLAAELGCIHINLSANALSNDLFLNFLLAELGRSNLDHGQLCFEITEYAATANLPKAADFIARLQAAGCTVALDNFGKGECSLDYLRKLPVDYVKIDGSLLALVAEDRAAASRVDAIHRIANFMGKPTIAERVESEFLLKKLESIGIDYAQGFSISKPVLLSER